MTLSQLLRVILLLAVATAVRASTVYEAGNSNDNIDSNSTRYLEEAGTIDFHIAMLNAVNKERASRGLPKLCAHRELQKAAQVHSADMARRNYLSHTGSDGSTASSRVRASGYRYTTVAENVAAGQSTVSKVMSSWMGSSGHRANLLSTKHKMFGCGYAYSSSSKYKHYWTQNFASGSGEVTGQCIIDDDSSSSPLVVPPSASDARDEFVEHGYARRDTLSTAFSLVRESVSFNNSLRNYSPHRRRQPLLYHAKVHQPLDNDAAAASHRLLDVRRSPEDDHCSAVAQEVTNTTITRELQTYSSIGFQTLMLNAVNKQRTANGLSKLCMNKKLQTAAQGHSDDMAKKNYMSHTGSDGSSMSQRITAAGYKWSACAENVAAGQTTVDAVMTAWMASSGHRANILSTKYTMFGCGYAYKSGTTYKHYWTQDFGYGATESCS